MTKLICHYYEKSGVYSIFTVAGLEETDNLFKRTESTNSNEPDSVDIWEAFNKCHLGKLLPQKNKAYVMYGLEEDLTLFKEKIEATVLFKQNVNILMSHRIK